ncbi:MAG: hypothetical protein ACYC35_19725 [Pirellulales bacterium]
MRLLDLDAVFSEKPLTVEVTKPTATTTIMVEAIAPAPCAVCGSATFYRTAGGTTLLCAGCTPDRPAGAEKLLVVGPPGGTTRFVDYAAEVAALAALNALGTGPVPCPAELRLDAAGGYGEWVLRPGVSGAAGWEALDAPTCRYPIRIPHFPPARGLCGPNPANRPPTIAPDERGRAVMACGSSGPSGP